MSSDKEYASFYLGKEQMAQLRQRSSETRLSMSEMVRQAIDAFLRGGVIRPNEHFDHVHIHPGQLHALTDCNVSDLARACARALRSLPADVQTPEFDALDELLAKVVDPSDVEES